MVSYSFNTTPLGAKLITPFAAPDNRGVFIKDFSITPREELNFEVCEVLNVQSHKGVLRGMHFQFDKPQAKLVRCLKGHIYDVIVDLRPKSPTFGQWEGYHLTEGNLTSLYVPKDFAHGYLVLEDDTYVQYLCDDNYHGWLDSGIMYNDKELNIHWPVDMIGGADKLIISDKDRTLMNFRDFKDIKNI